MFEMDKRNLTGVLALPAPDDSNEQIVDECEQELIYNYKIKSILYSVPTPNLLYAFYVSPKLRFFPLPRHTPR